MDSIKEKYFIRMMYSIIVFAGFVALSGVGFYYEYSIFTNIALILISIIFAVMSFYNVVNYVFLTTKKSEVVYEGEIDINVDAEKKKEKIEKSIKIINKIMLYSLYATPALLLICILLGMLVVDSLLIALVIPAFIIMYLVILFFVKEYYTKFIDSSIEEEYKIVYLTNKILVYKNTVYLLNKFGFSIEKNKYKFFKFSFDTIDITDQELLNKLEGNKDEVRD